MDVKENIEASYQKCLARARLISEPYFEALVADKKLRLGAPLLSLPERMALSEISRDAHRRFNEEYDRQFPQQISR